MKLYRFLLPLLMVASFASTGAYGQDRDRDRDRDRSIGGQDRSRFDEELNERDWEALREFLNTKRTVDIKEKACNLGISGDVRAEWRHLTEAQGSWCPCSGHSGHLRELRGGDAVNPFTCVPISKNDFDIEFNLRFDYTVDRTWAVAHLQYDNSAGIDGQTDTGCACDPYAIRGSGTCDDICLKKAYMGYNLCSDDDTRFDIELGRRGNLYNVFDSRVQFLSRLDGIVLHYASSWDCVMDWYWKWAGFVVDERVNQFAWATEIGFINICDTGFDFKYSFIDWVKNGGNRCWRRARCENERLFDIADDLFGCGDSCDKERFIHDALIKKKSLGSEFRISQFTVAYNFNPDVCGMPAQLFGAFLCNHAAKPLHLPTCIDLDTASTNDFFVCCDSSSSSTSDLCSSSTPGFCDSSSSSSSSSSCNAFAKGCGGGCNDCGGSGGGCGCFETPNQIIHFQKIGGKQRYAWYLGFRLGDVVQEGDWAFEVQYQVVQANAVPDVDECGIGRGNVLNESYTEVGRGNTNFRGWKVEGLYALTDDITIDTIIEASRENDARIGGKHRYSKVEVEAIYAF